jgi:hypothetical protein
MTDIYQTVFIRGYCWGLATGIFFPWFLEAMWLLFGGEP